MRPYAPILLICAVLIASGCDSPTSSRTYSDSISLGTGRHGIDLTGESTTFYGTPDNNGSPIATIYWRVESKEKLRGASVQFTVEKSTGVFWEQVFQTIYEMTELDDYVVIQPYIHQFGQGRFRATGYIPRDGKSFGPVEFSVALKASKTGAGN